jgi:branched-chain amino acid transport system ATP-binding protein
MLELERIGAAYGAAPALWEVSLTVNAGELVTVVGPNGAGKSTLINTIAGLHPVRDGTLKFEGQSLNRLAPHRFCELGIVVVPEGRRLFAGMTVLENLELGAYRTGARAERARQLEAVLETFPMLRERRAHIAGTLSGGQQQALAIGRALMAQPKLLLLDEPSLGLAPAIVADLFQVIRDINQRGVAVLLVEQNVAMAMEVATRAYVLEEGRIAAQGAPNELLARPEIRRAYLGV